MSNFDNRPLSIAVGEMSEILLPWSEVCVEMGVAGTVRPVILLSCEIDGRTYYSAQICNVDGTAFSFPVTLGEAGIYRHGENVPDGPFFYYYNPLA